MTTTNSQIEKITPSKAKEYMQHNKCNRPLNQRTVSFYASQMKNHQWMLNGEAICFSSDGTLLNGQHRLSAIILSGASVEILVVRGLDKRCFTTYDTGKRRTGGEVLRLSGVKNSNITSAIISHYLSWRKGLGKWHAKDAGISNTDIYDEYWSQEEYYDEITRNAYNFYKRVRYYTPSDIGWAILVLHRHKAHSMADIIAFFDELFRISNLSECNAINLLRQRLITSGISGKQITHRHKIALLMKAWNAYISKNNDTKVLKWNEEKEPNIDFI